MRQDDHARSGVGRRPHWGLVVALLAGLVLYAFAAPPGEPVGPAVPADDRPGELRAHFLDVGQGDATLLAAPDATMLVDTGRHDRDDLLPQLRSLGIDRIDVVAVTHPHADHIGQFDLVLDELEVAEVWWSGTPHDTRTFERALAALERSDAAYSEPRAGDETAVGSLHVRVLHPGHLTGDLHRDTLVLQVAYGDVVFLFTGDAEGDVEDALVERHGRQLASTVYQVGHHGSATSSTPGFLAAVRPEVAVYSAGAGNPYGHPHGEVVERLEGAGARLYGTDVHGTVTVTTDGSSYAVRVHDETAATVRRCAPTEGEMACGG